MDLAFMVLIFYLSHTPSFLMSLQGLYISVRLCLWQVQGQGWIPQRQIIHRRQGNSTPAWKRSQQDQVERRRCRFCNRVHRVFHHLGTVSCILLEVLLWLTMWFAGRRATWRVVPGRSLLLPLLRTSPCTSTVLIWTSTSRTRKSWVVSRFAIYIPFAECI